MQPISQFIGIDDLEGYHRHREALFETGMPQACEMRMVKQDGTAFWARLDATAAHDENGAPVCRIVMSDITERKMAGGGVARSERRATPSARPSCS
jgi:PAS domain S-box-containing protein